MFVLRLLSLALASAVPALAFACTPDGSGRCIALDGGGEVQLEASLRLRGMYYDPTRFGIQGREDGYGLLRALSSVTVTRDRWEAMAQLGVHAEQGRDGGPGGTDRGALDLQQGYLRWHGERLSWQLGRQEAAYGSSRLLSVRDGPNIRLAFDGVRGRWQQGALTLDVMALRPVDNRMGAFDDRSDQGQFLVGSYATWQGARPGNGLDLYLLGYGRDGARFASAVGDERRTSLGARGFVLQPRWNANIELVAQRGTLSRAQGDLAIRAWTLATDSGVRWPGHRWHPRLGVKLDIASGDRDAHDGRLDTFNAMYPKSAYFSEASLLAPANLMDVQPTLSLTPRPGLTTEIGWQLAWKHRRSDAVYTTPAPLAAVPGTAGTPRRIGQQYKWETSWEASRHWTWKGQLAWFEAGPGLRAAGGRDTLFASVVGAWQW
ncbi:alginate export family protein [Stenotrophomonas sp. NPDC047960]|uniref:alginate export family protein n=1 Tax=Stenotrophomonas sp. NPDC047960 TaxID=3364531 RepID=UPI00371CE3F9